MPPCALAWRLCRSAWPRRGLRLLPRHRCHLPVVLPPPPPPAQPCAPQDDLSAFLGEVGGLADAAVEKQQALERTHAPIALAKEAYSSDFLSSLPGGVKALMDGTAGAGAGGSGATTASEVLARWAALGAGTEEEAAERARAEAEAIARVSTGREYELSGEAAAAQSAACAAADLGSGEAQVERLLGEHHAWLNLNAFEVLALPHSASEEDIKQRYRRISALVHPDKCSHSAASDAFQEVKKAYDALLDPNKRRITAGLVHVTLREVRRERRKAVARLEAAGLFGELARLPALAEVEAREVRKAFADVEHRKATYEARIKAIAAREAEEAAAAHERQVEEARADVAWAEGREARAGQWREFGAALEGGGGGKAAAGVKRPREEGEEGAGGEGGGAAGAAAAAAAAAAPVAAAATSSAAAPAPTTAGGLKLNSSMRYGANAKGGDDWKSTWR